MTASVIMMVVGIILFAIAVVMMYLFVKRLIKYNSELKNGKTKRETELEKMNIDDL